MYNIQGNEMYAFCTNHAVHSTNDLFYFSKINKKSYKLLYRVVCIVSAVIAFEGDYVHHMTTRPSEFSDHPTALCTSIS